MKKEKKEKDFLHKPIYPGGPKAMRQLIRDNLHYPEAARQAGVEGSVSLRYTINHLGKVTEVKVIAGLGYGCDEEAVRLVNLLQFEVPKNRGLKVLFHRSLQVHFRLHKQPPPAPKAPAPAATIHYEYVPQKAAEPESETKKPGDTYTYTINW